MPTLEYKGKVIEFDHEPSQEDIDQSITYINSLVPTMSGGEAFGKGFLKSVLDYSSQFNRILGKEGSKTADGLTLDEESQLSATKDSETAFKEHPWATGAGAVTGQIGTTLATPGTISPGGLVGNIAKEVLPRLGVMAGMGLTSTGSRKTELMEGDSSKRKAAEEAALTGGMSDAVLSGILPAGISKAGSSFASQIGQRVLSGAGMNYAAGATGDVLQNIEANLSLKQVDPLAWDRRVIDVATGGILGPVLGTTMGKMNSKIKGMKKLNDALDDPTLNSFDDAYKVEGFNKDFVDRLVTDRVKNQAETQVVRFENELENLHKQLAKTPIEKKDEIASIKQEIENTEALLKPAKDLVTKHTPGMEVREFPNIRILNNVEDSRYVAGTTKNNGHYINLARVDEIFNTPNGLLGYFAGSPQKTKMLQENLEVSPRQFASLFPSKENFIDFLIKHEQYHVDQDHRTKYPKTAEGKLDLMTKEAVDIETESTLHALSPEQKYKLSRIKKANEFKQTRNAERVQIVQDQKHATDTLNLEKVVENELNIGKDISPGFTNAKTGQSVKQLYNFARSLTTSTAKHLFGVDQKGLIYFNRPVLKAGAEIIKHAFNKQRQNFHNLLDGVYSPDNFNGFATQKKGRSLARYQTPDSARQALQQATDMDAYVVMKLLTDNYGKNDYSYTLQEFGSSLTPTQKALFQSLSDMFKRMYEMAEINSRKLGKKSVIPYVPGWVPSVRRGKYGVNLRMPDMRLADSLDTSKGVQLSNIVYTEFFETSAQAKDFMDFVSKNKGDSQLMVDVMDLSRISRDDSILIDMFIQELHSSIEANKNTPEVINEAVSELHQKWIQQGGTLGSHHKYRVNIPGFAGSDIFQSPIKAGKAFKQGIVSSVEDYTRLMMKMEIGTKFDKMLADNKLQTQTPNVAALLKFMEDYALNKVGQIDDNPRLADKLGSLQYKVTSKPNKISWGNKFLGLINHAFYIDILMSQPDFHASQYVQGLWSVRSALRENPGYTGQALGKSINHLVGFYGKGIKNIDPEIAKFIYWGTQNRPDSFSPQFVTDVDSFFRGSTLHKEGNLETIAKYATLETPAGFADSVSRLMSALWMYEVYKDLGYSGLELYNKAIDATDQNMVRYEKQFKAPIFHEAGAVGQMASPLHTFPQAMLGNIIGDIRYMIKQPNAKEMLKASLPLMGTVAVTALITGVRFAPIIVEYELFALIYNEFMARSGSDSRLPRITEWVLEKDNPISDTVLEEVYRHGLVSAGTKLITEEGIGLTSANQYRSIFDGVQQAETSFIEFLPGIKWATDQWDYNTTLVSAAIGKDVEKSKFREAILGSVLATPGAIFDAGADILLFDALNRKANPDKKGHMFDEQTITDVVAKGLGTDTLQNRTQKEQKYIIDRETKLESELSTKFKEILVDAIEDNDKEKQQRIINRLLELRIQPSEIQNTIMNEVWKRNVPQGMRQFVSRSGQMSPAQMRFYLKYKEKFNTTPIDPEEE